MHILEPGEKSGLHQVQLPGNSAFIVGHEEFGISFDPAEYNNIKSLPIPQYA